MAIAQPWARLVLTGTLLVAAGAGCSSGADPDPVPPLRTTLDRTPPKAERGSPGPVRTDLEPLTRRFAALGTPRSARWQSGVLGTSRAPGPSSFWIDAVVTLAPETADHLAALGPAPVAPPTVTPALAPIAPAGPWLRGPALDRAFVGADFSADAYLDPAADVVVLLARGGN